MILQLQVISNLLCNVAANFVDPFIRLVDKNCWSDGIVMMTKEVLEVAPTTSSKVNSYLFWQLNMRIVLVALCSSVRFMNTNMI